MNETSHVTTDATAKAGSLSAAAPAEKRGTVVSRVVPIVVTVALTMVAVLFWQKLSQKPQAEGPPALGPIPVQVLTVSKENVPTYPRFLGQTEASQVVNVHTRVSGYLVERTFKEGDPVKKGQLLFRVDPRPYEANLNVAKAQQVSAEATLARAQSELKRYRELSDKGSATPGEVEEKDKDARVGLAKVDESKANVDSAALQLEYTSINSPIDGLIGQALKDVGNYVDSGQAGEVAVIQTVNPIYVKFSVTERDILTAQDRMKNGELSSPPLENLRFKLTLSDKSEYPTIATLNYADVKIDPSTGSGVVRGTAPNPDNKLKPGMFVYATILDQKLVDVICVPQQAVLQSPAGANVMLMNDKDMVEVRPVTLGEWSGTDKWIIRKGINPGDRVIVDRIPLLRPGAPVMAVPASEPATQVTKPNSP